MHCLIHYLNCYYIYLISAMCSIFCWIYYRVVVKINLYQCQCQCHIVHPPPTSGTAEGGFFYFRIGDRPTLGSPGGGEGCTVRFAGS